MKVLRVNGFKIRKAKEGDPGADLWDTCCRKADRAMEEFSRGIGEVWDTDYPAGIVWEDDDEPGVFSVSFDIVLDADYLTDPLNPSHEWEIYDDPEADCGKSQAEQEEENDFWRSRFVPA